MEYISTLAMISGKRETIDLIEESFASENCRILEEKYFGENNHFLDLHHWMNAALLQLGYQPWQLSRLHLPRGILQRVERMSEEELMVSCLSVDDSPLRFYEEIQSKRGVRIRVASPFVLLKFQNQQ